jgi:hypothetical protein
MIKISEAISRVRNQVRAVKQDASLRDRFLFSLIMKHARFLMRRQDSLNRIMKFNSIFSTLSYVELIDVDAAEAECFGVKTNCTFKRTKDKLPKAIEGYYGPLLRSVSSLDLSQQVLPTFPMTWQQMANQKTFKYNKKKYYWYLNDYLYFPNIEWDAVKVEGVFENDISQYNCSTEEEQCNYMADNTIAVPEFLFSEIEQLVVRDLGVMLQIPADPGQDAQSLSQPN